MLGVKLVELFLTTAFPLSTWALADTTSSSPMLFLRFPIWRLGMLILFFLVCLGGSNLWGNCCIDWYFGGNGFVVTCGCAFGLHGAYVAMATGVIYWSSWSIYVHSEVISASFVYIWLLSWELESARLYISVLAEFVDREVWICAVDDECIIIHSSYCCCILWMKNRLSYFVP